MTNTGVSIEDREAIRDLFARYSWAYDTGHPDEYVACFTADGYMADGPYFEARGHDQLRQAILGIMAARGDAHWQHINDHFLFRATGDAVVVHSYWSVLALPALQEAGPKAGFPKEPGSVLLLGRYETRLVQEKRKWLIQRRLSRRGMAQEELP